MPWAVPARLNLLEYHGQSKSTNGSNKTSMILPTAGVLASAIVYM
jgi:hypothetical protein